jgi:hypothetical protein
MPTQVSEQRVLAIFANPKGTDPLRLGEEDRVLRECLRLARHRRMNLEARHAATVHDLRRELLDEQAHVVHFSGHGTGHGLAFEDESGRVKVIPPAALGDLLAAYVPPIHTVVLNACYSNVHAEALRKIPYAVVMRQAIADRTAIEFARGFYDALAAGKNSEFAFFEGLRTINLLGLQGDDIPQLFEMGMPVATPKANTTSSPSEGATSSRTPLLSADEENVSAEDTLSSRTQKKAPEDPDAWHDSYPSPSHSRASTAWRRIATVPVTILILVVFVLIAWIVTNKLIGTDPVTDTSLSDTGGSATPSTTTDTTEPGLTNYKSDAEQLLTNIKDYIAAFDNVNHYEERRLFYGPVNPSLVRAELDRWRRLATRLEDRLELCRRNPGRCGSELMTGISVPGKVPAPGLIITYTPSPSEAGRNADIRARSRFFLLEGDEGYSRPLAVATIGQWTAHDGEGRTCDSIAGFLVFSSSIGNFKLTDATPLARPDLNAGSIDPYRYFLFGWPVATPLTVSLHRAESSYDRHGACSPAPAVIIWQPDSRLFEPESGREAAQAATEAAAALLQRGL